VNNTPISVVELTRGGSKGRNAGGARPGMIDAQTGQSIDTR
jgi:hypothetical protein